MKNIHQLPVVIEKDGMVFMLWNVLYSRAATHKEKPLMRH